MVLHLLYVYSLPAHLMPEISLVNYKKIIQIPFVGCPLGWRRARLHWGWSRSRNDDVICSRFDSLFDYSTLRPPLELLMSPSSMPVTISRGALNETTELKREGSWLAEYLSLTLMHFIYLRLETRGSKYANALNRSEVLRA